MTPLNKYQMIEETCPLKKGKKELLKYLSGSVLTAREAISAKCYECMGYYVDGVLDCKVYDCPMYGYAPYGTKMVERKKVKRVLSLRQQEAVKRMLERRLEFEDSKPKKPSAGDSKRRNTRGKGNKAS